MGKASNLCRFKAPFIVFKINRVQVKLCTTESTAVNSLARGRYEKK